MEGTGHDERVTTPRQVRDGGGKEKKGKKNKKQAPVTHATLPVVQTTKTLSSVTRDIESLLDGYMALMDSPVVRPRWFRDDLWAEQRDIESEPYDDRVHNITRPKETSPPLWKDEIVWHIRYEVFELVENHIVSLLDRFNYYNGRNDSSHENAEKVGQHLKTSVQRLFDVLDDATPSPLRPAVPIYGMVSALYERSEQMVSWLVDPSAWETSKYAGHNNDDEEDEEDFRDQDVDAAATEAAAGAVDARNQILLTQRLLATIYDSSIPWPLMSPEDPVYDWWRTSEAAATASGRYIYPMVLRPRPRSRIRSRGFAPVDVDENTLRDALVENYAVGLEKVAALWEDTIAVPVRALMAGYEAGKAAAEQRQRLRGATRYWLWDFLESMVSWCCSTLLSTTNPPHPPSGDWESATVAKVYESMAKIERLMQMLATFRGHVDTLLHDLTELEGCRAQVGEALVVLAAKGFRRREIGRREGIPYNVADDHHHHHHHLGDDEDHLGEGSKAEEYRDDRSDRWIRDVSYVLPARQDIAATLGAKMHELVAKFEEVTWWESALKRRDYCLYIWDAVEQHGFAGLRGGGANTTGTLKDEDREAYWKFEKYDCDRWKEDIMKASKKKKTKKTAKDGKP